MSVNQASIIESLTVACKKIDQSDFIYEFMDAYGFAKGTVTRLRNGNDNRNVGENGATAIRKQFYFLPVENGEDVGAAAQKLKSANAVITNDIRFVMATDFKTLIAYDLHADDFLDTPFSELPKEYGFFLPLAGYEKAVMYSEHPADLKASEKMGRLFDLIRQSNKPTNDHDIHALNVFLTRILFCFYAEDTEIFEKNQMTSAIQSYTKTDGSDMDIFLYNLFTALNLKKDDPKRLAMPSHLQAFPYVNGGLFEHDEPVPAFGARARRILIDCAQMNWSEINPDIFGSMFQAVIDEEQRGNLGQHYTSVSNIMKVIAPLFLDGLYEVLEKARGNEQRLKALLVQLERTKIFDVACGSGNFLIIAYKELRRFEMQVIDALNEASTQRVMYYSGIRLSQFYGIEIDDFAHEIASLSLWLAEHQMNMEFKEKFGYTAPTLPLKDAGNIVCGNSLRMDWDKICPKYDEQGNPYEVYLCGNPPFLGTANRTAEQSEDMDIIFKDLKTYKSLDYVSCFFWKGAQYIKDFGSLALVSTSSICQGEQVSLLWPPIFNLGLEISFAHTSFSWTNNAKNKAAVHVVIVGLISKSKNKTIYKEVAGQSQKNHVKNISPYLVEGSNLAVSARTRPFETVSKMIYGNKPVDGGNLLLNPSDKDELLDKEPLVEKWVKRLLGSEEFINAKERYCLWLADATQADVDAMPLVKERVNRVKEMRLASRDKGAQRLAARPHQFRDLNNPTNFILVPSVSSERRPYIPIGFFDSTVISTNANQIIPNGTMYEFALLNSEMHNDWMRAVGGRLESRYRYSGTLVYNTFPWPDATAPQRQHIEFLAEEILLTREDYPTMTLAQMYDPNTMPAPLLAAHKALDSAVEKLYRKTPFRDAPERLTHLFGRYEKLIEQESKTKKTSKRT